MFFALVAGRPATLLGHQRAGLSYPVYANTHTQMSVTHTHTHTKEVEEMRRARRIPSEGSSQAHPQRQPRREDQKMKVGGRRFEFRRGMHSTARRSTTTTTSHARGPIYIRLTSRRDRETPHTRLQINGGLGAHRAALFFFTARENAFDSRDTFKDADGPSKASSATRTHAHTCTGRRGRASSTARSFNFRQAETTRLFGRSTPSGD